jgi:hypothetical protein
MSSASSTYGAQEPKPAQLGAVDDIREKVAALQGHLLTAHPLIPTLLRTIHTQLKADPEIVTLMSEEEIKVIVSGLQYQTKVKLVEASTPKKKSLKKMDLDDF